MKRESFIFYKSFYDSIKELDLLDQAQIYNAIFQYQFEGEKIELIGICKSIFTLIIPQLEANNKRYKNGLKGGAPKNNQNAKKKQPKNNQKTTKKQPNENENENVNVNDNEKDIKENIQKKYFESLKVNTIFNEFLQLRKKLKAVNTDRAINMLINKLNEYDEETQYEMIEQSIVNSWKGLFELKNRKNKGYSFSDLLKEENYE